MASQSTWTKVGRVTKNHDNYKAEVDTYCLGERYKFTGPPRGSDEHKAFDDLLRIRASAEKASTRAEGLESMRSVAQELRDAAKVAQFNQPRKLEGGIEARSSYSYRARIQYWDPHGYHVIVGPIRTSQRRAETDLAKLREASQGHDTWKQQLRAVQAEVERLIIQA